MELFTKDSQKFEEFFQELEAMRGRLASLAPEGDRKELERLAMNFERKTEDFYRENRKLNIGVVGQVKAGKSSFLNTLLFGGREILILLRLRILPCRLILLKSSLQQALQTVQ